MWNSEAKTQKTATIPSPSAQKTPIQKVKRIGSRHNPYVTPVPAQRNTTTRQSTRPNEQQLIADYGLATPKGTGNYYKILRTLKPKDGHKTFPPVAPRILAKRTLTFDRNPKPDKKPRLSGQSTSNGQAATQPQARRTLFK